AMRQAHADGWFIVFDTLTLADDRLEAFYDNPNALRDYFRDIGRMVLAAEGRKANDSHADCYQYFCVPEYGTRSEERFSRNAETDLVCRLLLEKKKKNTKLTRTANKRRDVETTRADIRLTEYSS